MATDMSALSAVLHDVLAQVLRSKPSDPLLHIMSHLREKVGLPDTSLVSSAYRTLHLSPANEHLCDEHIAQAWRILGSQSDGHVTAEQFLQLSSTLMQPLTGELQQRMTELITLLAQLPPDYATFRAATKSCMLLEHLSTYDPTRGPSDQSFSEAEARRLLTRLMQLQHWFLALQPMPEVNSLEWLSATQAAAATQEQLQVSEQQAAQLVAMALAAASEAQASCS